MQGELEIVKYLVEEKRANINKKEEKNGCNALHCASMYGHLGIVKYLVEEKGANINEKEQDGKTALHYASESGYLEIVKYLVEKGADLCLKTNRSEKYAFDFIANNESLKTLMKNKMKIQKFQKFKYTTILRFNRLLTPQVNKNIYKRVLFELILGYTNEIK